MIVLKVILSLIFGNLFYWKVLDSAWFKRWRNSLDGVLYIIITPLVTLVGAFLLGLLAVYLFS